MACGIINVVPSGHTTQPATITHCRHRHLPHLDLAASSPHPGRPQGPALEGPTAGTPGRAPRPPPPARHISADQWIATDIIIWRRGDGATKRGDRGHARYGEKRERTAASSACPAPSMDMASACAIASSSSMSSAPSSSASSSSMAMSSPVSSSCADTEPGQAPPTTEGDLQRRSLRTDLLGSRPTGRFCHGHLDGAPELFVVAQPACTHTEVR
jgi:hypothetical protein